MTELTTIIIRSTLIAIMIKMIILMIKTMTTTTIRHKYNDGSDGNENTFRFFAFLMLASELCMFSLIMSIFIF